MSLNNSSTNQSGYSFVEILVTVALLGIIVVGFSRLFMASLIGEKKARNLEEVKQNGNYALTVMAEMIRNAQSVENCAGLASSLTILNQDGETTDFICDNSSGTHQIASNSANLIANDQIRIEDTDCNIFNCQLGDGKPDLVKINFTLSKGVAGDPGDYAGDPREYVSQNFQTSVSLRSY